MLVISQALSDGYEEAIPNTSFHKRCKKFFYGGGLLEL